MRQKKDKDVPIQPVDGLAIYNVAKMRAYIAGPYNSGGLSQKHNVENTASLSTYVFLQGYNPINPVSNYCVLEQAVRSGHVTEREILALCFGMIEACSAAFLSPTWLASPGASIEKMAMEHAHLPIHQIYVEDLEGVDLAWHPTSWDLHLGEPK